MVERRVVVDHVVLVVADLDVSTRFYDAALGALGFDRLRTGDQDGANAYGVHGADDFAIVPAGEVPPTTTAHVAFVAESQDAVDAFYTAALAAGGTERAGPRVRDEYSTGYYGAFVNDPDGNNIEAVFHAPS
jgi:catechol 2,3-dioxygenase-like lactoylglutathione lyase family enzyme